MTHHGTISLHAHFGAIHQGIQSMGVEPPIQMATPNRRADIESAPHFSLCGAVHQLRRVVHKRQVLYAQFTRCVVRNIA